MRKRKNKILCFFFFSILLDGTHCSSVPRRTFVLVLSSHPLPLIIIGFFFDYSEESFQILLLLLCQARLSLLLASTTLLFIINYSLLFFTDDDEACALEAVPVRDGVHGFAVGWQNPMDSEL